jgi:hypothetical protein
MCKIVLAEGWGFDWGAAGWHPHVLHIGIPLCGRPVGFPNVAACLHA